MRWLLLISLLSLLAVTPGRAFPSEELRRAVLITVPGEGAIDLLRDAADDGRFGRLSGVALAAVSAAVPGPDSSASAYATLGAGVRVEWKARGGGSGVPPLASGEDGSAWLGTGSELGPGMGTLGSVLRAAGRSVAFLGDGTASEYPGYLASITVDGELPQAGPLSHGAADRAEAVMEALAQADFVHAHLPSATPRSECLELFAALIHRLDPARDLVLLTSPDPGIPRGGSWPHLAPLLLWGGGWSQSSATSSTTRRLGLVTNSDLAPTLLAHFGISPPAVMEGHVLQPASVPADDLIRLARHARAVRVAGIPVLFAWGILALFGVAAILVSVMRGTLSSLRPEGLWRLVPAAVAAFPAAFLLAGISPSISPGELVLRIGLAELLVVAVAAWLSRWQTPLTTVFSILVLVPAVDLLTGGVLLFRSVMGDFLNTGVRFYGIGNEYEGLVLAASVVLPFFWHDRRFPGKQTLAWGGRLFAYVFWALVLACVALPGLGADFGGALALGAGFLTGAALSAGKRLHPGRIIGMFVVVAGIGLLVAGLDLMRPPEARTHVGELAARALEQGGHVVFDVALRKVLLNLKLATTSYFLGGLAAVAALAALCYDRVGPEIRRVLASRPLIRTALLAAGAGGLAALMLNDSGVVAGAMTAGCALLLISELLLADAGILGKRRYPAQDPPRPLV